MKRRIMEIVEHLAYWLGVDLFFYWLNRKANRVVAFHNVLPDECLMAKDRGGICFRASEFRAAIRELKKHFSFSVDQEDDSTLTLTFDDGYLNQYEMAAQILQEEGNIPAILFVSGSLIGSKGYENCLVIDKILQWQKLVPLETAEKLFGRSFGSRMELWSEALLPAFAADAEQKGRGLLASLEAVYAIDRSISERDPEFVRLRFDGVTSEQIADLRRRGWKVGYHTYSHYPVSRLPDEEARKELTPADPEMLKVPFAYPYGNEDFVSERDERIVESLGYPCAYSCGAEMTGRYGRRFFLCRMMPPIDKYRLHFELSGVRHFLKYKKLLPQMQSSRKFGII